MTPDFRPILRPIEVIPLKWQGKPSLVLRDPLGYTENFLVLPQALAPILALMDGRHSLRDLQVAATRSFGRLVMLEEVAELVKKLDTYGFLDGEAFKRLKEEVERSWKALPARPPAHAGKAYPRDPEALRNFLDSILNQIQSQRSFSPRILVAPHLDISSGAKAYAAAYRNFDLPEKARIVLIGTGHQLEKPFSVLTKDLETPFGKISVDRDFLAGLLAKVPELYPDEFAHRHEHALEFQVIFLQYLFPGFSVIPILFGPLDLYLRDHRDPFEAIPELEKLCSVLREAWDERTYMVVGIDFAHLGVRYGDPYPAGEKEGAMAIATDRNLLEALFSGNYQRFLEEACRALPYKVCGLSSLLFVANLVSGFNPQGEIYYQEAVPFGPGSLVSIAAAGLTF